MMAIKFRPNYLFITLILIFAEIGIGLYVHDNWIRPYGGDFLVVILLYCLVRSFLAFDCCFVAVGVLIFAYATEALQYFHIVEFLHLGQNHFARVLIGTQFSWTDMLMYTLGAAVVWLVERCLRGS